MTSIRPGSTRAITAIIVAVIAVVAVSLATIGVYAVVGRSAQASPPPKNGTFDYQLGGSYAPAAAVSIVERDHDDAPAVGRYSICYVNAFQTQPDERDQWRGEKADLVLHDGPIAVADPDWPRELLLDAATPAKRVRIARIMDAWIDDCAARGFRAVELDNLDSYSRSHGMLTRADNLALATMIVTHAHAAGLAVAQKNAPELARAGAERVGFDFAIAEECQRYSECGMYTAAYGSHLIEIEYTDASRSDFTRACAIRGSRVSVLLRDRDVVPRGSHGYHDETC